MEERKDSERAVAVRAAKEKVTQEEAPNTNRSPFLGIIGGLILVVGLFFGIYALRLQRR